MSIKLLSIVGLMIVTFNIMARDKNDNYIGQTLSEALSDYCKKNPHLKISFICDDLEPYRVKSLINSSDPVHAIRDLVLFNPISVTTDGDEIYVEALQKGKFLFSGRTVEDGSAEPVRYATVMLLNPKDSTAITYGVSDDSGFFSIPCDRRDVLAKFTAVGYSPKFLFAPSCSMGEVTMSILSLRIGEVVATAESRYAMSDRTVFLPSAREKKVAQGGAELLQFMAIPSINVNPLDQSVTTLSGQGVTLFIDYMKATADDLKALRPEDVKRVEVYDYPADPRFEGAHHAINFIMVKYEYGGYTKLSAQQKMDFNYGYYSLSSKFSYGRMTYDIYTGYDHFKADDEYQNSVKVYEFPDRTVKWTATTTESLVEDNEAYLSTRAKYTSESTVISNQFSIRRRDTPEGLGIKNNLYSPPVYPSGMSSDDYTRRSIIPSWKGNYQFYMPGSLQLVVTPTATYSRNTSNSHFSEDGVELINNVEEDAWNATLGAILSKSLNSNSVSLGINSELSDNRLFYSGSNLARIHYSFKALGARLSANLRFASVRLQPSVRFYFSHTKFGSDKYSQPLPSYFVSGNVNFSRKHQLSFSSEMSQWTIGASQRSPNLVVRNLLSAVKGNPNLKTWLYNGVDIDYTWIPLQWFNISVYCAYKRHTKPIDYIFTPLQLDNRQMMLTSYIKDGYFQDLSGGLSSVGRFFDNSLIVRTNVSLSSYRRGGRRQYARTVMNGTLSATYYLRNIYIRGYYEFRESEATTYYQRIDRPSYYTFSTGWAVKGWNLSAALRNFFRTSSKKGEEYMNYENYQSTDQIFGSAYHRSIWLNITYTINYGKKLKIDQIDRGNSLSSGIVN